MKSRAFAGRGLRPEPGTAGQPVTFGDRLAERVAARRSQLVLGLDPDPRRLWPRALAIAGVSAHHSGGSAADPVASGAAQSAAWRAAQAVSIHCALVIEAVAEQCVAVKLQLACFERLGAPGWVALGEVVAHARRHELLVIADAKRGDIDVSAAAYGEAFFGHTETPFGPVAGLGADALTVNPLLGRDALAPLVAAARGAGGGLFVLVRTSNPGAGDIQERRLETGETVSERIATLVAELGAEARPAEAGAEAGAREQPTEASPPEPAAAGRLADVGAVVGATAPGRLQRLRELMPRAVFLLPGVGAQGGRVEDLAAAFAPGPAAGLVTVSRALVYAFDHSGGEPEAAAAAAAERLRRMAWETAG